MDRGRSKIYTSKIGDEVIRGTAKQLVQKYEGLAYQAERERDLAYQAERERDLDATHRFRQAAEHYKRIHND